MKFLGNKSHKRGKKVGVKILLIFLIGGAAGFLAYPTAWNKIADSTSIGLPQYLNIPFRLGLDLQGGTHLVYEADLSNVASADYGASMNGIRDVIERRVNLFGVAEPVVQINSVGSSYRLIVELAGVSDVSQAITMIGQTPSLDFREGRSAEETQAILEQQQAVVDKQTNGEEITDEDLQIMIQDPYYMPTELTGRFLEGSNLIFDPQTMQPMVNLQFDDEGGKLFEEITARNVGKQVAIYLDNMPISAPVVQEKISGGKAQISGSFTNEEAKELAQRLNAGALPVPINLMSQQTVGAALGHESLDKSLSAAIFGIIAIFIFMIIYYRLPGLLASISLLIYLALALALFKLIGITLTLAGIAGFILSLGLAVDANVLIFERLKEELKSGKSLGGSIDDGFARAWSAIRDGNISTLITSAILWIFASGMIKGFALTLSLGVLVSMFTAIIVTKTFLKWFVGGRLEDKKWLWR